MKKFLIVFAVLAMILSCAACSKQATPDATEPSAPVKVQRPALATIEETVLFNKDGIEIVATALEQTENGGRVLVTMKNSTDYSLSFAADDIIVNGLTVTDGFCVEAPAGETVQGSIDISYRSMDNAKFTNIATIQSTDARIFENAEFKDICEAPFEIQTSADLASVAPAEETGTELYNRNGIRIVSLGFKSGERTSMARILVINDTDKDIAVKGENIAVDDTAVTAWLFDAVYAGTGRYCALEVPKTTMDTITLDVDLYSIVGTHKELLENTGSHTILPVS